MVIPAFYISGIGGIDRYARIRLQLQHQPAGHQVTVAAHRRRRAGVYRAEVTDIGAAARRIVEILHRQRTRGRGAIGVERAGRALHAVVKGPPDRDAVRDLVLVRDAAIGRTRRYRHAERIVAGVTIGAVIVTSRCCARHVDVDRASRRCRVEVFILQILFYLLPFRFRQRTVVHQHGRYVDDLPIACSGNFFADYDAVDDRPERSVTGTDDVTVFIMSEVAIIVQDSRLGQPAGARTRFTGDDIIAAAPSLQGQETAIAVGSQPEGFIAGAIAVTEACEVFSSIILYYEKDGTIIGGGRQAGNSAVFIQKVARAVQLDRRLACGRCRKPDLWIAVTDQVVALSGLVAPNGYRSPVLRHAGIRFQGQYEAGRNRKSRWRIVVGNVDGDRSAARLRIVVRSGSGDGMEAHREGSAYCRTATEWAIQIGTPGDGGAQVAVVRIVGRSREGDRSTVGEGSAVSWCSNVYGRRRAGLHAEVLLLEIGFDLLPLRSG